MTECQCALLMQCTSLLGTHVFYAEFKTLSKLLYSNLLHYKLFETENSVWYLNYLQNVYRTLQLS